MRVLAFLSLIAASLSLAGAILIIRGLLARRPGAPLYLRRAYLPPALYSVEQVRSAAAQRADALLGLFSVGLAILFQVAAWLGVDYEAGLGIGQSTGFGVVGIFFLLYLLIVTTVSAEWRYRSAAALGRLAIKYYCKRNLRERVTEADVAWLGATSEQLFGIGRSVSESQVEFLKRTAAEVGWAMPAALDLQAIGADGQYGLPFGPQNG